MDQYPFEFNFFIAGMEVDDFIKVLKDAGFTEQVKCVELQFKKQLEDFE